MRPRRLGASARAGVAILALLVGAMTGLVMVTAVGPEGHRSSTEPAAAAAGNDDAGGSEVVGTQAPRMAVGRSADGGPVLRAVVAAVTPVAGLAWLGTRARSCRGSGEARAVPASRAWAGPGRRRAPPVAAAA
jgi:hypothetical protein